MMKRINIRAVTYLLIFCGVILVIDFIYSLTVSHHLTSDSLIFDIILVFYFGYYLFFLVN